MPTIPAGAKGERTVLVTPDIAIDFMGVEDARVLATPHMIYLMELTSRDLILRFLEPGFDSVGTEVNIKHLAATPLGMSVTFHAEILEATDRRVLTRVEAYDEKEKIGEGTHERFIVNVARFAARIAAKRSS